MLRTLRISIALSLCLLLVPAIAQSQTGENIAKGKPATQSSEYGNGAAPARLAVDGYTDGNFSVGSVTHTAEPGTTDPWWQVDLGQVYEITRIVVYGRTDCCGERLSNLKILTRSSESEPWQERWHGGELEKQRRRRKPQSTFPLSFNTNDLPHARYVRIQLPGDNRILSLAEVEVYGGAIGSSAAATSCEREPAPDEVILYTKPNFLGECGPMKYKDDPNYPYSYSAKYENPRYFYMIGSVPFYSVKVGSNVVLTICSDTKYRGKCEDLKADRPILEGFVRGVNSLKLITRTPKDWNPRVYNDNQAYACVQPDHSGGCVILDIGEHNLKGIVYRSINVGANVKVQIYPDSYYYGTSTLYPPGDYKRTAAFKSVRVLASEDVAKADKQRTTVESLIQNQKNKAASEDKAPTPVADRQSIAISNIAGTKCLAVKDGRADDRAPVILANCEDTAAQKWTFTSDNRIRGLANMCLTQFGSLSIRTCGPLAAQRWTVSDSNELKGGQSAGCLSSIKFERGTPGSAPCDGKSEQRWRFEKYESIAGNRGSASSSPASGNSRVVGAVRQGPAQMGPSSAYKRCAKEGEKCEYLGEVIIAYGTVGMGNINYFNTKSFKSAKRESVVCNAANFGDPRPSVPKDCYIRQVRRVAINHAPPGPGYTVCADEPYRCNFNYIGTVAFGANGFFAYKSGIVRGIDCNVATFGDPAPGIPKKCYSKFEKEWKPNNTPRASTQPAPPGPGYRVCASEGQLCRFRGTGTVAFGYSPSLGGFTYKQSVNGSIRCTAASFGEPTNSDRVRACYVKVN